MKKAVRIRMESKQADQTHVHQADGELYDKNGSWYLLYEEPETDAAGPGRIRATVKWDDEQIKVVRRGAVESELTFRSGARTAGSFALTQGRLPLECYTHGIDRRLNGGLGSLSWSYDLYADGAYAGRIRIRLTIEGESTE